MFIGHYGVGLAAKKSSPRISLGTFFMAVQFLDLLWPIFLLLDMEKVAIKPGDHNVIPLDFTYYPFSHSLLMAAVWAILFGLYFFLIRRNGKGAFILGLCVISHWFLDLIVHNPDLPLFIGQDSPMLGLGLWNYPSATALIEGIIFFAGCFFYLQKTTAKNSFGRIGILVLIFLLLVTHVFNMVGPKPEAVSSIAWGANLQWIFVLLSYLVDYNRRPND